ncbi:MAG: hypothetical protein F4X64_17545 [Chloroflexi bacterium]|nr:hypothetical protein [Chloroflexota bacterium]
MKPTFFGDSHDMAKRQIMHWLTDERWYAHPMWYNERPEPAWAHPFLQRYEAALNVDIVAGESPVRAQFLAAAQACEEHLLLDPDTGLWTGVGNARNGNVEHVTLHEFIPILNHPNRQNRLTLLYDQGYSRGQTKANFRQRIEDKLQRIRDANVHAGAYIAHSASKVVFIWASQNGGLVAQATQRMQQQSSFPAWRFL